MATLVVVTWDNAEAWASDGAWSRSNLAGRLGACTSFRGTLSVLFGDFLAESARVNHKVPVSSASARGAGEKQ